MSIERIVAQTSAGPLLGGLDWRPPSGGAHSSRALHEAKSHTDSTHFTLLEPKGLVRYGLYKARASEENIKLPKGVVSAAACFAQLVGTESPNAALVLPIDCDDDRAEQKYLVIVLEDGVPHIDAVVNEMAARDTIGSEERPMWAFNKSKYPNCRVVDFSWLAAGSSKSARVLPIPINPWPIVLLLGLSSAAALGWWLYQNAKTAEANQRQAALVAAADPAPKYLAALRAQAPHMATRREDVLGALPHLLDFSVTIPGWQLSAVECGAATQQCTLTWARKGGTFDDIRAALPTQTLAPVKAQGSTVPMIDMATTITSWPIQRESLLTEPTALPSFDNGMVDLMPLLQVWRTAGLDIDIKPAILWPPVPGVPNELQHPSALHRGQIFISGVPGPFIQEVLETAPRWIQWETVRAELSEGGDTRTRLSFKATGNYYVSTN
jgi:hypothetical protein